MNALRRLARVDTARVVLGASGDPSHVDGRAVELIRERWIVEEGWWTDLPTRRSYLELLLVDGTLEILFHDLARQTWHRHATGRKRR